MATDIYGEIVKIISRYVEPGEAEETVESLCTRSLIYPEDFQATDLPTLLLSFCSNDDILDLFEPNTFADMMDSLLSYATPVFQAGLSSPWDLLGDDEEDQVLQKKVWDAYNTQKDQAGMLMQTIRHLVDEIVKERTIEGHLRDSEHKFQRMLHISPDTTMIHIKGKIVYANPASVQLFGAKEAQELVGRSVMELIQTSYQEVHTSLDSHLDDKGGGEIITDRIIRFDGRYVDVNVTASPTNFEGKSAVQLVIKDITDKVRAQRALKESETRYRLLAENIADVIWTMDMNLNFTYISPSIMRLRGYTVEEALNQSLEEVLTPESLKRAAKFFREELDRDQESSKYGEAVRALELEQYCKDGSTIRSEVRITGLRNEEGETIGILGVTRDVTERRKAEEKLASSEAKFRRLFDKMLEGVYRTTPKGKILSANPALVKMLGYDSIDDLKKVNVGKHLYMKSSVRKKFIEELDETGELRNLELKLKKKDGTEITVLENAHVIKDKKGKVRYYEGTLTDITGRLRVDRKLKQSKERFSRLFENMIEGVFQTTPTGEILSANPAMVEMLGYGSEKELKKIDIANDLYVDPNLRKTFIRKLGKDDKLTGFEIDMRRKDGRIITVVENVRTVRDEKGKVLYYEGTMEDVTEKKEQEEALRKNEVFIKSIMDNIGIGVAVIGPDMRLMSINRQIKKWFPKIDIDKHPLCYEAYKDPPGKGICDYCPSIRTLNDGKTYEAVSETQRRDGVRNYRIASTPLKDVNGNIIAAVELIEDITERKKTEEALKLSEQRLRRLVESLGDGVCIADKFENFLFVNPAAEKIFGVGPGELKGRNLKEFVTAKTYKHIKDQTKKRKKGESGQYDIEVVQPGGDVRLVIVNATPRLDEEGNFTSSFGIFTDITQRKMMEQELTESQVLYKELVERADIAIVIDDKNGNYIYYNQMFLDMYGYSDRDMKKLDVTSLVHPDDQKRVKKIHMDRLKSKDAPERYRFKGIKKSGEMFWVEVDAVERIVDGKINGTRAYLRDITKEVEMEELYRDLVNKAGIAIIQDDAKGGITFYNSKFLTLYGYSEKEMKDLKRKDLVHPEDYKMVMGHHKTRMKGEKVPSRYRFRGRRKTGETIHIEVDVSPIMDEGEVVGTRAYLKDVTEIWEMEEAMKRSEEMFKDLVEKAGIAIVIDTAAGEFKYFNQKFLDIFGHSDRDMRQLSIGDLVHPDDYKKVLERHRERVKGVPVPSRYRFRGVQKNGQTVYLEVEAVEIIEKGKVVGTRSYIWDITKRLKVEESIKKHKALIDSMRGMESELKKTEGGERKFPEKVVISKKGKKVRIEKREEKEDKKKKRSSKKKGKKRSE